MTKGDLVKLTGSMLSSWSHQDQIGVIVSDDHFSEGLLVFFSDGQVVDFSGYPDHLTEVNDI